MQNYYIYDDNNQLQQSCHKIIRIEMSRQIKLTINSMKYNGRTKPNSQIQSLGTSLPTIHFQGQYADSQHAEQKINKLQGRLNLLEKKYRSNIKEGFDCKIKAYRLQAAIQRKILKHTIVQANKYQNEQKKREKIIMKEKQKQFKQFRLEIAKIQKQQKQKYIRMRNLRDKKRILVTMQQKRRQYNQSVKQSHDQILLQQSNINKKRDYLEVIKKETLKRDEFIQKRQILGKLIENNQKLKQLKDNLMVLKSSIEPKDNTFLTI